MFRASPIHLLNDPFEVDPQEHQLTNISKHLFEEGELTPLLLNDSDTCFDYDEHKKWFVTNQTHLIKADLRRFSQEFKRFGVVSLTEDYQNLLMWSHYADEHRGIVVELSNEVSWLKHKKSPHPDPYCCFESNPFNYCRELPQRVVYRSDRPSFEFAVDVVHDLGESKVFDNYFYSKGDSWIYEKEHRSVLPLMYADKILTNYTSDVKEYMEEYPSLKVKNIERCSYNNIQKCELTFSGSDCNDARMSITYLLLSRDNNPMFFYGVDESFISCIYLGCRVTDTKALAVLDAIKRNPRFDDSIVVKRAKLSKERYSLEFETISYPMLYKV